MKRSYKILAILTIILNYLVGEAQNPIAQTNYTADPALMVYNGKVYIYTSHDRFHLVYHERLAIYIPRRIWSIGQTMEPYCLLKSLIGQK